ncbi:MAG TPA: hypothetical protein VF712_10960 [Thermoleophilaceae bacterium]|jgi:hypothetical protein
MTDEDQMKRFREAVDEKGEAAKAASEQGPGPGDAPAADQAEPAGADLPQDEDDQRKKNSRHGQVTADKWNQ